MISYEEYGLRKIKAGVFIFIGFFLMCLSLFLSLYMPKLTWFIFVPGLILFLWGLLIINKLRYERENEGHRLYHYKGRF